MQNDLPSIITQLVPEETNNRRGNKDAEGQDGVDEGHVDVADTDVLHVYGEVRQDGEGGGRVEEQGQLQRQQGLANIDSLVYLSRQCCRAA
jgi:hypothetical protein